MIERNIALHTAVACLLWPAGVILVCVGLVTKWELGQLGIVVCMIAAMLNIRGWFCALTQREREAYEMGREVGIERGPRSLR